MTKFINLTGQKFGRLTALKRDKTKKKKTYWICKCICGTTKSIRADSLKDKSIRSCGCLHDEGNYFIHGQTIKGKETTEYGTWRAMKNRCNNPLDSAYKNYGGRGIKVCQRWNNSFKYFFEDMGKKPFGFSIDRSDNNKNYEPDNCRWVSRKKQNRNKRSNVLVTYQGKTQCLVEWAEESGISYSNLRYRLKKYSPEIAFNM